ncbi:transcription factor GTE9 isoform X2 [Selaginella moellendorffii]|uniref:transcription factor GTE9 isoform X2 n=1 Tax=Selaginella moellendorffii TaxID=88036 RepID=UPI000D1CE3AC|nr:transcription factor GTE9 isoform X2 [Selaginella moellendorffii]|eukprot:XP_024526131.1 transcription factor GTE9 isoform X2 [Selaginella moellendorffii]
MESVSAMPKESKREVRKRLKLDLEQVIGISTKIEALEQQSRSSGTLGTPGTGGSSKEKRTPKANQMYSTSEYFSAKDKMPPPEKVKPKALVPPKKGTKGDIDNKRQRVELARMKRMGDIMKQCGTLLKKLITHKHAWVFNEPVDAVKLGLHDYHKVIRRPMDLGTIKKKLEGGHYRTPVEFADDVKLTFSNAMTYNPPGHDVFIMADILRQIFDERWRCIKEKLEEEQTKCRVEDEVFAEIAQGNPNPALQNLKQSLLSIEDQLSSLKKPAGAPRGSKKSGKRQMTYEEKTELGKNLEKVLEQNPGDKADEIVLLLKKHNPNLSQSEDTIEVDIDGIDNDTLWELHKMVASCMKPKNKKRPRPQPAEGIKTGGTAPGDSPKKSRKSGEGLDEDVDIDGEDDMPTANYSPVVVDKDTPNDGRESSGGSSSSSSGSDSSESDSGSSSHSDSDAEGPRTAGIEKPTSQKEPMGFGAVREQLSSPSDKIDGAKQPVTVRPGEAGDLPESQAEKSAEKLQSERPVSPEKSVRAALLKGRFADTILKAREKTFPLKSGDNVDPEKLRKEREELERKLREDKARLQADAKAAEVARKKAEAEAATEARKKREVEREAARKALQQMERTVDLDAHCEILKDFDLMRTSSKEHFQSSAGEVSPPNSPDGLPGFTLPQGAGNALEQLGLFMKLDEEEDDKQGDGEVAYADENGEVEEGEID